jgi:hypothetical protein
LGDGISNRVFIIIGRCIDQMNFAAYMAVPFITFFRIFQVLFFIIVYIHSFMFSVLLFNLVYYYYYYVFLLLGLRILIVMYVLCVLFHCVVLCTVCV